MASPSKSRSATHGLLPSPSNTHNSPNPSDNIDLLLSLEKVVSGENSPSSNKKKRTREETDLSDSDVPQLLRRSNRNPRIGSGFNNQPDNPVHIADEDVETDVEVEERGGAAGVDPSGYMRTHFLVFVIRDLSSTPCVPRIPWSS